MLSSPDTSVVICAYTEARWQQLCAAVQSVQDQTCAPLEIIVVSDHNPALLARVRAELPGIHALDNVQERGLSGARNTGVAAARGSIVAFLDDDAVADPDWLTKLTEPYADPLVLGVGGAILPAWESGRPAWFPHEFDWVVGCTYRGLPGAATTVRNLIGCNMSLRRDVFRQVGGFRAGIGRLEDRPVGCEETELCIRVLQSCQGARLIYVPEARVHHHVPRQRASWRYYLSRCHHEGLSKAAISRLVGKTDALSRERQYTLRVLPRGVARNLRNSLARRQSRADAARALAIVAGLFFTTRGYLQGRFSAGI
jgi:GT2 family glycosyltransferase